MPLAVFYAASLMEFPDCFDYLPHKHGYEPFHYFLSVYNFHKS
jgi:hypothetical protein